MWKKILMYYMSLGLFFFFILIKAIDIPIYLGKDWVFIGFEKLLKLNVISIVCIVLLFGVLICIRTYKQEIKGCLDTPKRIVEIENTNENYIVFLTTYIIPLLDWDMNSFRDIMILMTIIIVNGWLLIKTNLYYQNPILGMMGFNVYRAMLTTNGQEFNTILVSEKKLKKGDIVRTHNLDANEIMLAN